MEKEKIILDPSFKRNRKVYPLGLKFFGFLFLFLLIFLPGYSKFQELSQKNKLLEEKIRQMQISNERFKKEIKRLQEDPTYVEKIARDKLKVTKKGEVIYKIIEKDKNDSGD